MKLDDALDACATEAERDSLKSIAITKTTNTNFSLSNVNFGIRADKRHPMPFDPANFTISYSHSHKYTSGETTVYEKETTGAVLWITIILRPIRHFNHLPKPKSKSKWLDFPKQIGINYLPQNISFNSEMTRVVITNCRSVIWRVLRIQVCRWHSVNSFCGTGNSPWDGTLPIISHDIPVSYPCWDRRTLYTNQQRPVSRPLQRMERFSVDEYQTLGKPWTIISRSPSRISCRLTKYPFSIGSAQNGTYSATYNWVRGTDLEDGTTLGNTITNNRDVKCSWNIQSRDPLQSYPVLG